MRAIHSLLLWAVVLCVCSFALPGQEHATNPFHSPGDLAEGKRLYRMNCGVCHGMDGNSGRGAPLATRNRRHGVSDRDLYQIIANGVPGTEMPGLWFDEDSIWKIILFTRTFEKDAVDACPAEPGDPGRGREVFSNKGSCPACHAVGMGGGRLGPELTSIGQKRSRHYLREALIHPHKEIPKAYRAVKLVTGDGRRFEGILMNEDDYTLHLLDRQEEIRSFQKAELQKIERPPESLMPGYGEMLSEAELNDLLSYLCALKGPSPEGSE